MDFQHAQRLGHALRRRRPVAGQQRQVLHAQPAQLAQHRRRLDAHLVARADRPQHPAAAGDQQRRLPVGVQPFQQGQRLRRHGHALLLQQPAVADDHRAAGRAGRHAAAGVGAEVLDRLRRQPAPRRLLQDDPGQRVFAALLRRRGHGQQLVGGCALKGYDFSDFQPALGERAGLIEGEGVDAGQSLQGRAALEQHAGPRQPAQRRQDRRRRRQDQGARTGHHQHRQRRRHGLADGAGLRSVIERQPAAVLVAAPQALERQGADEGDGGQGQHGRQEPPRQPVGGALDRRLVLEGLRGQLDDLADDGVFGDAAGLDGQGAVLVERAGQHLVARPLLGRQTPRRSGR